MSGIGHMTLETIKSLQNHSENQKTFEIVLVVCYDRVAAIQSWNFTKVKIKKIPVPTRWFNLIWKYDVIPYMDIFLGRGTYIFFNYKNWRLLRSRSLTYVCDVGYLLYPEFVSPKNLKFLKTNVNKWVKRTSKVVAISTSARNDIVRLLNVDNTKISLIPCGVDKAVFYKRSSKEIDAFRLKYGIENNFILYLGNIEPRKNIMKLIKAYRLLPQSIRNKYALLLVGGGGWLNQPIIQAIEEAQREGYRIIRPTAYIKDEDLPTLHSAASILVHPAVYEGFGISPLQALACETPVIVSQIPSLQEVVGNAGIFIDHDNEYDISDKINLILTNQKLRQQMIKRGLNQANKFTWDNAVHKLVNAIEV